MHPLLIPYAILTALFVVHFHQRDHRVGNAGLVITSAATIALLSAAMVLRPADGDSGRYYGTFLEIRNLDFSAMLQYDRVEPLFKLLNWAVGQLGSPSALLFAASFALYCGGFIWALYRLLGPRQAAVLFMCYAAYPFFITYSANGLRQGLALVCMLMALVQFRKGFVLRETLIKCHPGIRSARLPRGATLGRLRFQALGVPETAGPSLARTGNAINQRFLIGWLWLLPMPFWHGGSLLGAVVVALFVLMVRLVPDQKRRWWLVAVAYAASLALSVTGLNEALLGHLPDIIDLEARHQGYFLTPEELGTVYQTGFRIDFTLFSLLPLMSAFLFRKSGPMFSFSASGWWLSVYLLLNCIFHLFSFAPFSDRFSAYSWFLLPLVLFMQVQDSGNRWLRSLFVVGFAAANIILWQLYTGSSIRPPEWW